MDGLNTVHGLPHEEEQYLVDVYYKGADDDAARALAYFIDKDEFVDAFVKNAGLGLAIPYLHNGQMHDYAPDFIVRLKGDQQLNVILETKGYDPLKDVKKQAAERWASAVNADGRFGIWRYQLIENIADIPAKLQKARM